MPYTEKEIAKHNEKMTSGQETRVQLVAHEGVATSGRVLLKVLTDAERNKRGSNFFLVCAGLGVCGVILPPHFLWPIVGILAGVLGAVLKKGQKVIVMGGEGECPQCHAFQILDIDNSDFPFVHFCTECRSRCVVESQTESLPQPVG